MKPKPPPFLRDRLNVASALAKTWWTARAPRERAALVAMAAVLALAATLAGLDALLAERARLAHQLPQLHATLAQMQDDATELARLRTLPAPARGTGESLGAAQAAARAAGLQLDIQLAGDGLEVRGHAALAPLAQWLAAMQAEHGLHVERLIQTDGQVEAMLRADVSR
jgi:type II secretory pathway component PulM